MEGGTVSDGAVVGDDYDYDDWAELLASFFFDEAHAGEEVLFAVDELSLAEASGHTEEDAGLSLGMAVRQVLGTGWDVGAVHRLVGRWRADGASGPHPALPFLALTVLAASRMGSYEGYAPHKFYVPLRRALLPEDPDTDAPGNYLGHVEALWSDLVRWANNDLGGQRGQLCIRDPGRHYGRGLALQHALLKSSDLRHLDAFFRRIGLQPQEDVPPAELRRALAAWSAGRPEPWAQRLARISADEELAPYAEALLNREAHRWDGRPRDPRTGRPVGRLRLGLQSVQRPALGLYAQWDERLPESIELSTPSGGALCLTRRDGWYEPQPIDDVDVLAADLSIRGERLRFDFRSEDVYALGYDIDLGLWVSVDSMSYGDQYHLVARQQTVNDILRFLHSESSTEPRIVERASRYLPLGWHLIADVRIDARPRTIPPEPLRSLIRAGAGPRLRLFGGLPLPISPRTYLRGGEPFATPGTLSTDDRIEIREVSTGKVERFRITGELHRDLKLWDLKLPPGTYEISNDGSKVTWQIEDGIAEAAGNGAGSVATYEGRRGRVVGTTTSNPVVRRRPVTIKAPRPGAASILIGAQPGEHDVVRLPLWLKDCAGYVPSWKDIDAWPDFDPAWCLVKGSSGQYEASALSKLEPVMTDDAASSLWGRTIAVARLRPDAPPDEVALWARYRHAAGAVEG